MIKQIGLTLMELVIAIVVAMTLGAGGIVLYQDLTGNAKTAAKNDLAAKVTAAITLYIASNATPSYQPPTGTQLTDKKYMQNVICSGGTVADSGTTSISVQLMDSGGNPISNCSTKSYGVSIP